MDYITLSEQEFLLRSVRFNSLMKMLNLDNKKKKERAIVKVTEKQGLNVYVLAELLMQNPASHLFAVTSPEVWRQINKAHHDMFGNYIEDGKLSVAGVDLKFVINHSISDCRVKDEKGNGSYYGNVIFCIDPRFLYIHRGKIEKIDFGVQQRTDYAITKPQMCCVYGFQEDDYGMYKRSGQ